MTVGELIAELEVMPHAVTVLVSDSQYGDRTIKEVLDTLSYCDSARIVRLEV